MRLLFKNFLSGIAVAFFIFMAIASSHDPDDDKEESMETTKECIEDKIDDEMVKFQSIDEALTAYDFTDARTLLSCYEDACFRNEIRRSSCPKVEEDTSSSSKHPVKEAAASKADENPHFKELYRIVQAEITYFLKSGEMDMAKSVAEESGMDYLYKDHVPKAINNLISNGKFNDVMRILSLYTFEHAYDAKARYDYGNKSYNQEIHVYNDMVNSLTNTCIFDNKTDLLKKALILYKPEAVEKGKSSSALKNNAKNDALKKIKEAGITL